MGFTYFRRKLKARFRPKAVSPKRQDGRLPSPQLSEPALSVTSTLMPEDLWVKAEERLRNDRDLQKILEESVRILETNFALRAQTGDTASRQGLCDFLDTKFSELEEKKWVIQLGSHSFKVKEQLNKTFRNVMLFKDIINTAATASPPAAIACAGATVVLLLVVQAGEQHETLLQGLEEISSLIPLLREIERSYLHSDGGHDEKFVEKFKDTLISLYSKILEFQARALCYLQKRSISQLFADMFKQDGWDKLLADINRLKSSTRDFRDAQRDAEIRARLDQMRTIQAWQTTSARDERIRKSLKMLYTCPYGDRKDRNNRHIHGTCEWFTQHELFRTWKRSERSYPLWVSTDPGCGKSVLAKYLVDEFLPRNKRTICYFFFKDDFEDQKNAPNAIAALLRQTFIAQPHLLTDSILDRLETDGEKLVDSFGDLWSIFMDIACSPAAGEVLCVLDALDECRDGDRKQFIQAVEHLYLSSRSGFDLKFLMTSRPYDHIRRDFSVLEKKLPTIHLSGEGETEVALISREIDLVIKDRVDKIGLRNTLDSDESAYLKEMLTSDTINRTYLWVTLTLDVIEGMPGFTRGNIRRAIHNIPKTVDDAYTRIIDRSYDHGKAKTLLHIVTAAERPLTLEELSAALAFSEYNSDIGIRDEIDTDEERFQRIARDLCGLLLVVIDTKVYLLHQTVKEFLVKDHPSPAYKWKYSLQPIDSHLALAKACTSFLVYGKDLKMLREYASRYWASHFQKAQLQRDHEITNLGLTLCQYGTGEYLMWSEIYFKGTPLEFRYSEGTTPLMIASSFGLTAVVELLLATGQVKVDCKNDNSLTPLLYAASGGYKEIVELLLATGQVDVNSKDNDSRTALSYAASGGHKEVVKLLLATKQVKIDCKDNRFGWTPLLYATSMGHKEVVQLLLATGQVEVDCKDNRLSATPLSYAAIRGRIEVVKLLLATGQVEVNSKNKHGLTPLVCATLYEHKDVITLLLATGQVEVDSKDNNGRAALSYAAGRGNKEVMELLLATGKVEVDSKDTNGRTSLSYAAIQGYKEVVKLLLATGQVEVDCKDTEFGATPLLYAAYKGSKEVVELLLATGQVDVDSKDNNGRTPLSVASLFEHVRS